MRDLLEWLEEVAEQLVDEEASTSSEAPASISREALHHEPSIKVVSGNHSNFTHFPKDEIAKSARPLVEDALAESYFVQKILVI